MRCLVLGAAVLAVGAGAAPVFRALDVELPFNARMYPALGRGAPPPEAINNNCLACHSIELVMTQPKLTRPEWTAEVTKMRSTYKAPVDPADDAAIIEWLVAMSAKTTG